MKYQKRNRPYENVKENVLVLTNDGKSIITLNNTAFAIWQNCEGMSACRLCDRILTFSEGKVIEDGTFDELIERKGKFYELYMAQKEYY